MCSPVTLLSRVEIERHLARMVRRKLDEIVGESRTWLRRPRDGWPVADRAVGSVMVVGVEERHKMVPSVLLRGVGVVLRLSTSSSPMPLRPVSSRLVPHDRRSTRRHFFDVGAAWAVDRLGVQAVPLRHRDVVRVTLHRWVGGCGGLVSGHSTFTFRKLRKSVRVTSRLVSTSTTSIM